MTLPTAVYRLQFRAGMDFARAAGLAPYLARLGISHLYASPLFTARAGSTHGYDVTDPGAIDPALGGRPGLEALSAALTRQGLGLILDIVPNHMAFSTETPWLRDVLRHGRASRHAGHFDIDWAAGRLRLPWLTDPFETVLARDGASLGDAPDGPVLRIGGLAVPLADTPSLDAARGGDRAALRALHAEQPWRLVHWRTERDALSHRRFFSIAGLIGVRVDDARVFEDTHRLLFDLIAAGIVHGIRIDHIDGLVDPAAYLARLRDRVGDTPIWVEKILTGDEALPGDWPVQGTTGYVAARAFARLLTDARGVARIDADWRAATGQDATPGQVVERARRQVLTGELAAELWTLHGLFARLAAADPVGAEFGPEALRDALIAYVAAFPRYRSYTTAGTVGAADAALIRRTARRAAAGLADPGALPLLADLLTRPGPGTAPLRLRMQQVTGAAVAKSVEDTAFYRFVRLLSENEVGGAPGDGALDVAGFHRAMRARARAMPHGLTLTSSHDSKRSEDARMRVAAITHDPAGFAAWRRICAGFAPPDMDPVTVWYAAQTLLAIDTGDGDAADRLAAHMVKALREAKQATFWTAPDAGVEGAARDLVRRLARRFARPAPELRAVFAAARRMVLVQTALKLTVPGIPDIYQGAEAGFHALTDPDNRRAVDFDRLAAGLDDPAALPRLRDAAKLDLTRTLLQLRRARPALFLDGAYRPVAAPPDLCVFDRAHGGTRLRVALALNGTARPDPLVAGGTPVWPRPGTRRDRPVRIAVLADD